MREEREKKLVYLKNNNKIILPLTNFGIIDFINLIWLLFGKIKKMFW